jgi:hypothetical protein
MKNIIIIVLLMISSACSTTSMKVRGDEEMYVKGLLKQLMNPTPLMMEAAGSRGGFLKPTELYNFGSEEAIGFAGTGGSLQ